MNSRVLTVAIASIFMVSLEANSQTTVPPCEKQVTAVVLDFKGACSCQTGNDVQRIVQHIGLRGGQKLQCKRDSTVTFRFCRSKKEKTIAQNAPKWYILPNVPSPQPVKEPIKPGGKSAQLFVPENPPVYSAFGVVPCRVCSGSSEGGTDEFNAMLARANERRNEGHLDKALDAYQKAVKISPSQSRAYYGLGNAYVAMGKWQEAEVAYRQALLSDKSFNDASIALGFLLLQSGDKAKQAEAEKIARAAVEKNPKDPRSWDLLGAALEAGGFAASVAQLSYQQAMKTEPRYAPSYVHLSRLLSSEGKDDEAVKYLTQALQIARDRAVLIAIGEQLQTQGRYSESLAPARSVLSLDPKDERALFLIAQAVFGSGEYEAVIEPLESAIKLDTKLLVVYEALSWAHIMLDHPDRAEEVLEKANRLGITGPTDLRKISNAMAGAGDAYLNADEQKHAVKMYTRALKLDPSNAQIKAKLLSNIDDPHAQK